MKEKKLLLFHFFSFPFREVFRFRFENFIP